MTNWIQNDRPLPQFRKDLQLYKGPDEIDGSPTYNLFDPVRAQYYKVSWSEALILQHLRPGMTPDDLLKEINSTSTLKITAGDIQFFFEDALRHHLLAVPRSSDQVAYEAEKIKPHPLKWLLYNYLYFRIPLLWPDKFLKATLPYVRPLVSSPAVFLYALITLLGLYLLIERFDQFLHTFPYFFNLQGVIAYALGLTAIKVIHEFAHAYTAAYYGIHIPNMGVALIVLWPVLYTNVTDSWKLAKRRQRLAISIAGIAAELVIAGISTLGWAISPPGMLQSVFFVIASITWVSTLIINLNPAMRWDGYYLLCDLWGVDNLQTRAFSMTRWKLRQWLLGIDVPPPEEVAHSRMTGFFVYTIYTWIYRVFLYTTIALFVYYAFTKSLGILLFIFEVVIFLLWPIYWELEELAKLKTHIRINTRLLITSIVVGVGALWFFLPLPHMEYFPGITVPQQEQILYVPEDARIEKIYVKRNQQVKKGDPLIDFTSEKLNNKIAVTEVEIALIEKQIELLQVEDQGVSYIPEKMAELARYQEELTTLKGKRKELSLHSTINGFVYALQDSLKPGLWVNHDSAIGKIGEKGLEKVICFVPENRFNTIVKGQKARFRVNSDLKVYPGYISEVNPVRSQFLLYPPLASIFKGDLPVTQEKDGRLRLTESYYPVEVELNVTEAGTLRYGETGMVEVKGPWRSKFYELVRYLSGLLIRESGV